MYQPMESIDRHVDRRPQRPWSSAPVVLLAASLGCVALPRVATAEAGPPARPLFSGGMFFTAVPLALAAGGEHLLGSAELLALGIGGRLYFYLPFNLRLGGMGSVVRRSFGALDSRYESGRGGLTLEGAWRSGALELSAGLLVGGQSLTIDEALEVVDFSGALWPEPPVLVRRLRAGHVVVAPLIGVEWWLTPRLKALALIEYQHPALVGHAYGHTAQAFVGILFNH